MGMESYIDADNNFMFTTIDDDWTDQDLINHVIRMNGETEEFIGLREVADLRRITNMSTLSVNGVMQAAAKETDKKEAVLAILVPADDQLMYGMTRVFQLASEEHRKSTKIFTNIDECIAWLATDEIDGEAIRSFIDESVVLA